MATAMATDDTELAQLFRACDPHGRGSIGPADLRDLCAGFDIGPEDSDAIFHDLDRDADGRVSFEDFACGFRSFLGATTPTAPRERRHSQARRAWSHLVAGVGLPTINKFLQTSGQKLAELYEEIQTSEASSELVQHFEGAFSSLLQDVKKLHEDQKKMESMFTKEKEAHLEHLRSLEEELDAHVASIEQQAREQAKAKFEIEKRELQEKMESEMAELQIHLRLFQKVNNILSKKQEGNLVTHEASSRENSELRHTLADTKTNLVLLRTEMAQLRSEYEEKCRELHEQQETVSSFLNKNDHVYQQLQILQEANTKLQDTNDSLLSVMDASGILSSRPSSPCCCSRSSSIRRNKSLKAPSCSSSDHGSHIESAPTSLSNIKPDTHEDSQFGIRRFMEDLDSGRSTLRDTVDADSDKSLQDELLEIPSRSGRSLHNNLFSELKELDEGGHPKRRILSSEDGLDLMSPHMKNDLEPTGPPDRTFKIVFAGDAAVGKSCFIFRFSKGIFINNLGSTLGVDFQVKTIRVDGKNVALQLWDTAGQERFRAMTKTYFRRADGVLLLYDVTSERSFINVRQWIQSIDELKESHVPILVCGNKTDLRSEAMAQGVTCVNAAQGEQLAEEYGASFIETSSKSGTNIMDAICLISREMLANEDVQIHTSSMKITDEKSKNKCCKN